MKEMFRGYYEPSEAEFKKLWNDCLFVLDTNILLNFYRYSDKTNKDFFSVLEKISERLWIPYQVAFEYQKNRLSVISEKMGAYKELNKIIDSQPNNFKTDVQGKGFERHPIIEIKEIESKIEKCYSEIKEQIKENEKKHPNYIKDDTIRERISILLKGKIGQKFSKEKLNEIFKDGEKRFDEKIPPGFSDQDKKGNARFGDLIIWFEIIEKAKQKNKPVIFIVDDSKEDWWNKVRGETIGPRPELIQEFFSEVNAQFYMYKSKRFMDYAEKHLNLTFDSDTVKEIQEVSKEQRDSSGNFFPVGAISRGVISPSGSAPSDLYSKAISFDNYRRLDNSVFNDLLRKKGEIEKSIVENQIELLKLKDKQDEAFDMPGGWGLGDFSLTTKIARLEEKILRLKDVRDDINNILPTYNY